MSKKEIKNSKMKNLTQLLVGILLLISSNIAAQNNSDSPFLNLLAQPNETTDSMLLRWVASDYATWKMGVDSGYTLTRYTTHINGQLADVAAIQASKTVLATNLMPLAAGAWESNFPNKDIAKVAKGVLYETDVSTILTPGEALTLAKAVNTDASQEARFVFALFAAEQDFDIAKGMALGYCDATIAAGETYIYQLAINHTDLSTAITIEANNAISLPAVDTLIAEGLDKVIMLEWGIASTQDYYSSYDIECSTDGVTFVNANKLPFVFASDSEEDPTSAFYKDSIPDNTTIYHYRIRGRTPFGTQGPPSMVVQAQGMPPRISLLLRITDHEETATSATLNWTNFPDSMESKIQGFNIYRSEDPLVDFEKVNTNLLATSNRSYTDMNPLSAAYYLLEAVDNNDYAYRSSSTLVQLPDTIPPAIPVGLTGKFITDERVQLTWEANTEPDLKGYRLFVANQDSAIYAQITSQAIANEEFIYEIDPTFLVDSIYFKIIATDNRANYSDKSTVFVLKRPDITPPSNPVLQKVNPKPTGVEIGWRFSSSPDVAFHVLERRPANSPNWVAVLSINKDGESQYEENQTPGSITATCFIDTSYLDRRDYEYRMNAYDLSGNASSSDGVTIRPFDNGKRGDIENFAAKAECLPVGEITNQAGYTILENILGEYQYGGVIRADSLAKLVVWKVISMEEYELLIEQDPYEAKVFLDKRKLEVWEGSIIAQVNLKWGYGEMDQLKDFQIYRSAEGSSIMLYKTLPLAAMDDDYLFLDEDVQPNRRYFYQIIARHTDGGFSEKSRTLMVKVPKF